MLMNQFQSSCRIVRRIDRVTLQITEEVRDQLQNASDKRLFPQLQPSEKAQKERPGETSPITPRGDAPGCRRFQPADTGCIFPESGDRSSWSHCELTHAPGSRADIARISPLGLTTQDLPPFTAATIWTWLSSARIRMKGSQRLPPSRPSPILEKMITSAP